jgi:glycosyltransferase involved in cell wall biosynthesis
VVLCLLRNGRPYVRSFAEHYASLGAKHLVFLDNGSTDGTVEALREYDNVTVLRSTLPFKRYQFSMKRYLIERFGRGRS